MKKFGIEKEVFLIKGDKLVLIPEGFPKDECGWLLELRTAPHTTIQECVDDLKLQEYRIYAALEAKGYTVVEKPILVVPKELVRKALKINTKGPSKYGNYLGFDYHNNVAGEQTAAIHVTFSDQLEIITPVETPELWVRADGKIEIRTMKSGEKR